MSANPDILSAGDDEGTKLVSIIWEQVFHASNRVIAQSGIYGFHSIQLIPNPNIHQMLQSMRLVAVMMDEILGTKGGFSDAPEDFRRLVNARVQLTQLESVAAALISGNEQLYQEAIEKLKQQATF